MDGVVMDLYYVNYTTAYCGDESELVNGLGNARRIAREVAYGDSGPRARNDGTCGTVIVREAVVKPDGRVRGGDVVETITPTVWRIDTPEGPLFEKWATVEEARESALAEAEEAGEFVVLIGPGVREVVGA